MSDLVFRCLKQLSLLSSSIVGPKFENFATPDNPCQNFCHENRGEDRSLKDPCDCLDERVEINYVEDHAAGVTGQTDL